MTALAQSAYLTGRHLRFFLRQPWFIGISLVQMASPDWSFVLPRIALLVGLAAIATAFATRTFRAYQRSI